MSSQLPNITGRNVYTLSNGLHPKYNDGYTSGAFYNTRPVPSDRVYGARTMFMDVGNWGNGEHYSLGTVFNFGADRCSDLYKDNVNEVFGNSVAMNAFIKAKQV